MKTPLTLKLLSVKKMHFPCIVVFFMVLMSCHDMNTPHEKYTKNGEIIYASSLGRRMSIYPGRNRVQLSLILEGVRLKETWVRYVKPNGDTISIDPFVYNKEANPKAKGSGYRNKDSLNLIVPDIEEGSYTFIVFNKDHLGNRSITTTGQGQVYGDRYISGLQPRLPVKLVYDGADLELIHGKAGSYQRDSRFYYAKTDKSKQTQELKEKEDKITLTGVDMNEPISVSTDYVPVQAKDILKKDALGNPLKDKDGKRTEEKERVEQSIDVFSSTKRELDWPLIYNIWKNVTATSDGFSWKIQDGGKYKFQYRMWGASPANWAKEAIRSQDGSQVVAGATAGSKIEVMVRDDYGNTFIKKLTIQ